VEMMSSNMKICMEIDRVIVVRLWQLRWRKDTLWSRRVIRWDWLEMVFWKFLVRCGGRAFERD